MISLVIYVLIMLIGVLLLFSGYPLSSDFGCIEECVRYCFFGFNIKFLQKIIVSFFLDTSY